MYAAKRFSCGPGAERRDPTKQFYIRMFFYDPVVLTNETKRNGAKLSFTVAFLHEPLSFRSESASSGLMLRSAAVRLPCLSP